MFMIFCYFLFQNYISGLYYNLPDRTVKLNLTFHEKLGRFVLLYVRFVRSVPADGTYTVDLLACTYVAEAARTAEVFVPELSCEAPAVTTHTGADSHNALTGTFLR